MFCGLFATPLPRLKPPRLTRLTIQTKWIKYSTMPSAFKYSFSTMKLKHFCMQPSASVTSTDTVASHSDIQKCFAPFKVKVKLNNRPFIFVFRIYFDHAFTQMEYSRYETCVGMRLLMRLSYNVGDMGKYFLGKKIYFSRNERKNWTTFEWMTDAFEIESHLISLQLHNPGVVALGCCIWGFVVFQWLLWLTVSEGGGKGEFNHHFAKYHRSIERPLLKWERKWLEWKSIFLDHS